MNGKQARNLRRVVRQEASHLEEVAYEVERHPERIRLVGTKVDGSPQYESYQPETVRLANHCQRHIYQNLKALHHSFFGR